MTSAAAFHEASSVRSGLGASAGNPTLRLVFPRNLMLDTAAAV